MHLADEAQNAPTKNARRLDVFEVKKETRQYRGIFRRVYLETSGLSQ